MYPSVYTTTTTNKPSNLTKMLSLFRKSKSTQVMANANNSETTLVSTKSKRQTRRETEPYKAEFSGMGMMGGMPAMGTHMFLEPPSPTGSSAGDSKTSIKMVPAQPFKSKPKASFASERVETLRGMFQVASPPRRGEKSAQELLDELYTNSSVMIGGIVAPLSMKKNKVEC